MASCGNKIPKSLTENLQPNLTQPYNTNKTKNNFRKRILSTSVSQSYEDNTSKRYQSFLIVIEFPMTSDYQNFLFLDEFVTRQSRGFPNKPEN